MGRQAQWLVGTTCVALLAGWGVAQVAQEGQPTPEQVRPKAVGTAMPELRLAIKDDALEMKGLDRHMTYLVLALPKGTEARSKSGKLQLLGGFVSNTEGEAAFPLKEAGFDIGAVVVASVHPLAAVRPGVPAVPCDPKSMCPTPRPPCPGSSCVPRAIDVFHELEPVGIPNPMDPHHLGSPVDPH